MYKCLESATPVTICLLCVFAQFLKVRGLEPSVLGLYHFFLDHVRIHFSKFPGGRAPGICFGGFPTTQQNFVLEPTGQGLLGGKYREVVFL